MKKKRHPKTVAVLGGGSWGTALAITFSERHEVIIWEFDKTQVETIKKDRRNKKFLPIVSFPDSLEITNNISEAIENASIVVFAVPSHVLRSVAVLAEPYINKKQYLVSVTKGIENETLLTMTGVLNDVIKRKKGVIALSGPTHAEELAKHLPTAIVAASKSSWHAKTIQKHFMTPYFRIYTNTDVIGVEIGAALKNVIAIAAGISTGLNFGDNTLAAIITRGLAEIRRLGIKMGAREKTFSGLSGIGDLVVTCTSKYSRNRKLGVMLGHGRKLKDILSEMTQIAEGVKNTISAIELSEKYDIEMPLSSGIYAILYKKMSARNLGHMLMTRQPKSEN